VTYMDSMSTWCGVHKESMDFMAVFPTVYMESMDYILWTAHGLSVDSMRAASLIYLMKKNLNNIYYNKCSQQESNSGPFSHCKMTHQPAELTGHVSLLQVLLW
jgi:hypothetical protein